jgi:hypothetical protein
MKRPSLFALPISLLMVGSSPIKNQAAVGCTFSCLGSTRTYGWPLNIIAPTSCSVIMLRLAATRGADCDARFS